MEFKRIGLLTSILILAVAMSFELPSISAQMVANAPLGDFNYVQNIVGVDNFLQSNRAIDLGNGFQATDQAVALGGVCGVGAVCGALVPGGFVSSNTAIHQSGDAVLTNNGFGTFNYANNLVGLDNNGFVQQAKAIDVAGTNFQSSNALVGMDANSFVTTNSIINSNGVDFANRDRGIAIDPTGYASTDNYLTSNPTTFTNNQINTMLTDNAFAQNQNSIVSDPTAFTNVNQFVTLDPTQFSQGASTIHTNAAGFTNTNNFVGTNANGFLQQHSTIVAPNF